MQYWVFLSLFVLLAPFLIGVAHADPQWISSSWLKARQINITHADITADLTNYPVYINLTSVDIGTDAQADCDDFVFYDYHNTTQFNHEIETCDSTNNWAEFWVNVPKVYTANDTAFFMYYNNAAASNQQHTQETWNSNYKLVTHLNGTFIDSTSTPITCTNTATSAVTDEYIGDSRSWDGVDDYINCGSNAKIDDIFDGGGTTSGWANLSSLGEGNNGMWMDTSKAFTNGWESQVGPGNVLRFIVYSIPNTPPIWTTNAAAFSNNVWAYWVITYNDDSSANDPLIYISGASVAITQTNIDRLYVSSAANDLCIGNQNPGTGSGSCDTVRTPDGRYDEVRLVNEILTADWIKADWECQRGAVDGNSCILVGSQGTEPAGGSTVTLSDDFALEDSVTQLDYYSNVNDDFALEDSVTGNGSSSATVTLLDDFALEDSAGTNTVTVSDDFAIEDSTTGSTPVISVPIRNAIAIYLNSPTSTRLGGVFSGLCPTITGNATSVMIGIYPNGSLACFP